MTLCATNETLPGIRRCTIPGQHKVTCHDHPGWAEPAGVCTGCLPREADRGHLCEHCYQYTVDAVASWAPFRTAVEAADGKLVSADKGGIKSSSSGYTNLTLTFLTISECEGFLGSRDGRTVDAWIESLEGAKDAIQFAHAAHRAFRDLEVEAREHPITRQRCPSCEQLTLTGNPAREVRGVTVIECQHCGYVLDEVRMSVSRWFGSATCEHQLHAECASLACPCHCHDLGAQSRPGGVQALWDADQHTATSVFRGRELRRDGRPRLKLRAGAYRSTWIITDHLTIEPITEERAA